MDTTVVAQDSSASAAAAVNGLASREDRSAPYQVFIVALCFLAMAMLAMDTLVVQDPATRTILEYIDNFVCVVFLVDFVVTLVRSPDRTKYLLTWGWLDLLSSLPAYPVLRVGRTARVVRILRVLRAARAGRSIARAVLERRSQSAFLASLLLTLLVLAFSSIAALHFERDAVGANILTAEDALWWSVTTLSTVGYGDRFPVTTEARAVAMLLMATGVCLVATASGLFASWFIGNRRPDDAELAAIRREVEGLRKALQLSRNGRG